MFVLYYRATYPDNLDYTNVRPLEEDRDAFHVTLKDKHAVVRMKEPCASKEEARSLVDPFLGQWELEADLARPEAEALRFQFIHAEIKGPDPAPHEKRIRVHDVSKTTDHVQVRVAPPSYPRPPSSPLELSDKVTRMYNRYLEYKRGRGLLPDMANFCLTMLESMVGKQGSKRQEAARKFGIDFEVLSRIGCLCARKGGDVARKAEGTAHSFTPEEQQFLEWVIPVIIRRVAQVEAGPNQRAPKISLANYVERSLPS